MSGEQILLFSIFGAVFVLLLWGRYRYDLVAFGALIIAVLLGVVDTKAAFSGFAHPATMIVALVLVISAGLINSGVVQLITRYLVDSRRALGLHITLMGIIGAVLSAFMNNVAALALLMPVDMQAADKAKRAARLTLMPLSFATILGGMVTMIGTPPNIIIATIRGDYTGTAFGMFDFAPVGLAAALGGLVFVATLGWRLIPKVHGENSDKQNLAVGAYVAELTVPEGSPLIGRQLKTLEHEAERADVAIVALVREAKRLFGRSRNRILRAGDALVLEANPEALDELRITLQLEFAEDARIKRLDPAGAGLSLLEVVVPDNARIVGKSALAIGLNWRMNTLLMGISRQGRRINKQIRRSLIYPGDILLLLVPTEQEVEVIDWLGVLPLAERGLKVTQGGKTWLAVGLFVGAVALASFGLVYLPIALAAVVVLFALSKIVPLRELYDHIEWPVVVLLGAMIPLGQALEQSGGIELLAQALLGLTAGLPPWAILTVLMVVTMSLSDVLNNTATTIVAAPVGIAMAEHLHLSADPFLMAVAVAASCAFLTPIGHKNNTLILGPGGYRFGDYWRMGLLLEILIIIISIPTILIFWPLA